MSKQVNLSLATAGDVAVLRNGERRNIEKIKVESENARHPIIIYWNNTAASIKYGTQYTIDGHYFFWSIEPSDITDVLRNGASIFE